MAEISCCKKGLVYTFLGLNIFLSLVINLLLYVSTYDVIFLDWYQYIYLILAIIIWVLLLFMYIAKLILIIIGKLPSKYVFLTWMVLNIPASVFFLIAFIFDLVMFGQNEISWDIYIIAFVLVFILFIIFTAFDFFLIKIQIQMGENNGNKFNMIENNSNSLPGRNVEKIELRETKEIKVLQSDDNVKKDIANSQNEKIKDN